MDKETNTAIQDAEGNEITATTSFIPEEANGTADVTFTFDTSALEGTRIVVFEKLFTNDVEITKHEDINDVDQTVYIPKIGTSAIDSETKTDTACNDGEITIDDATVGQQMIAQFLEFPVQRVKSISNITRPDQEIVIRVFDANCNDTIDIRDVTEIQQYLAEIQQGIYVTEKIYKKTVGQRYGSLPQYQGENVQDTTAPNTEPTTTVPTQPVATEPTTIAPTEPTTVHVPVIQTTMKETIVDAAYTFHAGGKWEQHAFCKCCNQDLTIMYDKYCEEHPETKNDGLTYWAQTKHQHSEWIGIKISEGQLTAPKQKKKSVLNWNRSISADRNTLILQCGKSHTPKQLTA